MSFRAYVPDARDIVWLRFDPHNRQQPASRNSGVRAQVFQSPSSYPTIPRIRRNMGGIQRPTRVKLTLDAG